MNQRLYFFVIFIIMVLCFFFFSSRRRHTRLTCDWSSDVCSSDLRGRGCVVAVAPAEEVFTRATSANPCRTQTGTVSSTIPATTRVAEGSRGPAAVTATDATVSLER